MATSAVTLASFGGTFIEHRPGRRITSLPVTEDEADELLFLNQNDYRSDYIPLEEFADWSSDEGYEAEDDRSFAQRLLIVENLAPDQIHAAAQVVLDNPELLIELYAKGIKPEGIYNHDDKCAVQKKIFGLVQEVFTTMLTLSSAKKISGSLANRRDEESGKTLLSRLAQFARGEMEDKKCPHFTACTMLKALGYDDVSTRYLN